jgi:hypothetical protein
LHRKNRTTARPIIRHGRSKRTTTSQKVTEASLKSSDDCEVLLLYSADKVQNIGRNGNRIKGKENNEERKMRLS